MKTSRTSGHSTNLVSLRSLVPCAVSYGESYKPSKVTIKIPALESLITEGENSLDLVINLEVANKNAIDARNLAYKIFGQTLSSINNIVKASDTSKEVRTHVSSNIRTIRGIKLKSKKNETVKIEANSEVTESNVVVAHNMGYDIRLENFNKLIQYLATVLNYTPNEPQLTIAGLTSSYNDMKNKNLEVTNTDIQLTGARISRKAVFYTPSTGLAIAGGEAKNYIKAVFGVKSPEYKQVSKLKFKIYKN
jgi:hypothetical protein